jgi:exosortase C (VPDSG-CTERM-specific)
MVSTRNFYLAVAVLAVLFGGPLLTLCRFAAGDELFSYILLMPFVCLYLAWLDREKIPAGGTPAKKSAAVFFALGVFFLAWFWRQRPAAAVDGMALSTLSFVCLVAGAGCWFLGGARMRVLAFPFALLVFLAPFPVALRDGIETFLQHGSAEVADWMFLVSGMTYLRHDLVFKLPGISLQVAPECSGIHSTVVLFITSLVAGQMLLRSPGRRAVLTLFVLPLALARNAFRIFVLGELCVHVGPHMIDSPIHHRGGPIFFALSLIPFFALLYFLKRSEMKKMPGAPAEAQP